MKIATIPCDVYSHCKSFRILGLLHALSGVLYQTRCIGDPSSLFQKLYVTVPFQVNSVDRCGLAVHYV